jgi:CubicO group peptidase (beta-lactamase class C family)
MPEIAGINLLEIEMTMKATHIQSVRAAFMDGKSHTLSTTAIDATTQASKASSVNPDIFGAASLSKPVFSYLVLKLIDKGMLSRAGESAVSGLDRPLSEIYSLGTFFKNKLSYADAVRAGTITPRMLLSHQSGLGESAVLTSNPGTEYAYSGTGLIYLQKVIERVTGKSLEDLAQQYVFEPLGMSLSSFLTPEEPKSVPNAANSLHTTASDYAKLMTAWMQDPSPIMQQAFVSQISLTKDLQKLPGDTGTAARHVKQEVKARLAWGLGVGLELDTHGKAVKAFHTGDMNQLRAQMALDLEKESCIVYFSKGSDDKRANGHILAPQIITPIIPINYAHTWFYSKFPFAWKAEQLPPQGRTPKEEEQLAWGLRANRGEQDFREAAEALMKEFGTKPKSESSDAVMRVLMPPRSIATPPSSHGIKKQSSEESSRAKTEEILAETDKPSSPSPFNMTPKPHGYP